MDLSFLGLLFLKGLLIGFLIAAPVGPVGILCIRAASIGRYGVSLATGLGAALADTFYAAVAAFSLVTITNFISRHDFSLKLFGGVLISWVGYYIFKTPPQKHPLEGKKETGLQGFTSAFLVTLSNPVVLLIFAAAFATLGISPIEDSWDQGIILITGVCLGASIWWIILSTVILLIHHKLSSQHLLWINRLSGLIVIGFGASILLSLLKRL